MLILYVAVLLVMAALNIFLAFIIRQMTIITNRQVQMHFSRELGRCSGALDDKLAELAEAEKRLADVEQRVKEQQAAANRSALQSGAATTNYGGSASLFYQAGASYRDGEALEIYKEIRSGMDLDYEALVREVVRLRPEPEPDWEISSRILDKLDFEIRYELVTCTPERREEILGKLLDGDELEALERIAPAKEYPDPVQMLDRVRQYYMLHNPQVRVICGEEAQDKMEYGEVVTEYDPSIHEGIRVRVGTGELDYSL